MSQGTAGQTYLQVTRPGIAALAYSPNFGSDRAAVDQHTAQTLSTRGSFLPYLIGRRKIPATIGWVGQRGVNTEGGGGGKGGGGGGDGVTIFYEVGWHLVCVGPAYRLHGIYKAGKKIFPLDGNPIDRDSYPSGSQFILPNGENFLIYWGEVDQPVNTYLGESFRVGVTSRWPHCCYVVWAPGRLGQNPTWSIYEYDIETLVENSPLANSDAALDCEEIEEVAVQGLVNPAHAAGQILFDDFPHGLNLDQSLFNMDSLEAIGTYLAGGAGPTLPSSPQVDSQYDMSQDSSWVDETTASDLEDLGPDSNDLPVTVDNDHPKYQLSGDCQTVRPGGDYVAGFTHAGHWTDTPWAGITTAPFSMICAFEVDADNLNLQAPSGVYDGSGFLVSNLEHVVWCLQATAAGDDMFRVGFKWEDDGDFDVTGAVVLVKVGDRTRQFDVPIPGGGKKLIVVALQVRANTGAGSDADIYVLNGTTNDGESTGETGWVDLGSAYTQPSSWADYFTIGAYRHPSAGFIRHFYHYFMEHLVIKTGPHTTGELQSHIDYLEEKWSNCGAGGGGGECLGIAPLALNGKEASTLLGEIFQDIGMFWSRSMVEGLIRFVLVRKLQTASQAPEIPHEAQEELPQIEQNHLEPPADKIVFAFSDFEHNFVLSTVLVNDDGQADLADFQNARQVALPTVISFQTAQKIAERRSQEILAQPIKITMVVLREASRYLFPGRAITFEAHPDLGLLRVVEVEPLPGALMAKIVALTDVYDAEPTEFDPDSTGTQDPDQGAAPDEDEEVAIVEVPAFLLQGTEQQRVLIPRIRSADDVVAARTHFSLDNTTYVEQNAQVEGQVGGNLLEAIASDDPYVIDQGPTFTLEGPDVEEALDLSSSLSLWALGRQVCAIGNELFFLQKITAISGDTYRLDGLMRARYDTVREAHSIGSKVLIFSQERIRSYTSYLLGVNQLLYAKSQPVNSAKPIDLSDVTAVSKTLYGKGVRPMPVCALHVSSNHSNYYKAGEDVTLSWGYRTALLPGTGAGMQGAGAATGDGPVDGYFRVVIRTMGDSEVRSVDGLTSPTYVYDNADLISDLGGEVSFKVDVTNYKAGYESSVQQITVTKE